MPDYKRQHYLPAVYLKNFSADGPKATRKSHVWRIDLRNSRSVSVESQCSGDYLFSRRAPKDTEEMFHEMEVAYVAALKKIWAGGVPTSFEYFALIVCLFEFYTRNIVHGRATKMEGVEAYQRRNSTLLSRLIMERKREDVATVPEMFSHLKEFWRVRLLRSPGGEILTCDHPCRVGNWDRGEAVRFALMPVTSVVYAVAFDRRYSAVVGDRLMETDGTLLALGQIAQCNEALYCTTEPSAELLVRIRAELNTRETAGGTTDEEKWELDYLLPPRPDALSFLRPIKPTEISD